MEVILSLFLTSWKNSNRFGNPEVQEKIKQNKGDYKHYIDSALMPVNV